MQVGCGVYELEIRRHRYLYFWHYETNGGSRRQVKDYLGSAGSPESAAKAARLCELIREAKHQLDVWRDALLARWCR